MLVADNWFSSVGIATQLLGVGVTYTGTVKSNRMGGAFSTHTASQCGKWARGAFEVEKDTSKGTVSVWAVSQ